MARRRSPRKAPTADEAAEPAAAPRRASRAKKKPQQPQQPLITVRHMTRRDIGRVWDFLKVSFREVNAETVEYQRPRSKLRFEEVYEEEGIEQLVFEVEGEIAAYAECTFEVLGSDNWINPRYFEKRNMRPLFVDELAVHPEMHGRGVGSFVLEVAENNESALNWYKKRAFKKLDAAIFMAAPVDIEPELLPPRELPAARASEPAPDEESKE